MWIKKSQYNFLKENAEKNIDAECEIKKVVFDMTQSTARAMKEYSHTLEELDEYQKRNQEFYEILRVIKDCCGNTDFILNEAIKNERGEKSSMVRFNNVESFATYLKCHNDNLLRYIDKHLAEE